MKEIIEVKSNLFKKCKKCGSAITTARKLLDEEFPNKAKRMEIRLRCFEPADDDPTYGHQMLTEVVIKRGKKRSRIKKAVVIGCPALNQPLEMDNW